MRLRSCAEGVPHMIAFSLRRDRVMLRKRCLEALTEDLTLRP